MTRSAKHFEEFQPHTKHKHLILRRYFLAWGPKLGLRSGAGDAILYVDACAGRGVDDLGNQGSPLIAAVAAATAGTNRSGIRKRPFTIHVVAIESKRWHVTQLTEILEPFGPTVRVLPGTLAEHLSDIERDHPGIPALFFIDPFGLEPLDASVVRAALGGDRREALVLFADQAALRHFGAISANETRAERRLRTATAPLPLFPDLRPDNSDALAQQAADSRAQLEITRESAIRIMNAAFGDAEWLRSIEGIPTVARRRAFLGLYSARLRSWGAKYVFPIPIVDATGMHSYTLIHATKSSKGYAAMKESVTHALEHSPLPPTVVQRMRDLIACDPVVVDSAIRARFAGHQVRWAEDPANRQAPCIKQYLLEETPAFPFEFDSLKARIASLRARGRAIVYLFPESRADVDQD